MTVHDKGRFDFELSAKERETLLEAAKVVHNLKDVMRNGQYERLVTCYPDNEDYVYLLEVGKIEASIINIAEAWAIE